MRKRQKGKSQSKLVTDQHIYKSNASTVYLFIPHQYVLLTIQSKGCVFDAT